MIFGRTAEKSGGFFEGIPRDISDGTARSISKRAYVVISARILEGIGRIPAGLLKGEFYGKNP